MHELAEDDLNLYNVIIDILMVFRGRSCESWIFRWTLLQGHLRQHWGKQGWNGRWACRGWLVALESSDLTVPGNVWSRRMESNVENALVKLFPVRCDLLDARLALKVPQPKRVANNTGSRKRRERGHYWWRISTGEARFFVLWGCWLFSCLSHLMLQSWLPDIR